MISADHPLVSITDTRAPAARPPPSAASLFTRSRPPLLSSPLLAAPLRSAAPTLPRRRYGPPNPTRYTARTWIHSVLLLLRIPSRAPQSSRDPARPLHLPRISPRRGLVLFSLLLRATRVDSALGRSPLEPRSEDKGEARPTESASLSRSLARRFVFPGRGIGRGLIMLDEYEIRWTRLTIEGPLETRARVAPWAPSRMPRASDRPRRAACRFARLLLPSILSLAPTPLLSAPIEFPSREDVADETRCDLLLGLPGRAEGK